MISRRTAKILAEVYGETFAQAGFPRNRGREVVAADRLHDFLFEREHGTWILENVKRLHNHSVRDLKELIMGFHTGISLQDAPPTKPFMDRTEMGQRFLVMLTSDVLFAFESPQYIEWQSKESCRLIIHLQSSLELDGYTYLNGTLRFTEANVLDEKEEEGVLLSLISLLGLENKQVMDQHLQDSAKAYLEEKWWNCIGNSRAFMEAVLQEVADKYHRMKTSDPLEKKTYEKPVSVRTYLENSGLFTHDEIMAAAAVYGMMSETGSHPFIAEKDQARLGRNLALTVSQFALLKLQAALTA